MKPLSSQTKVLAAVLVGLAVFGLYSPTLHFGFLNWDDGDYVKNRTEFDLPGAAFVSWAFTTFTSSNWHPLTWLSLYLDHLLWGTNPYGYHLQNIVLHALNTVVLIYLLHLLFSTASAGLFWYAVFAGAVFGLHPLRVESVAWVSERKDLLCGLFYLASLTAYVLFLRADEGPRSRVWYGLSLLSCVLALLAKPMAVSLPVVLFIMDFLHGRRLTLRGIARKIPFGIFAAADALLTVHAQHSSGAIRAVVEYPLADRIMNAFYSYAFYLLKTLMPSGLSPFYPYRPAVSSLSAASISAAAFFLTVTGLVIYLRRSKGRRPLPAGWAWYVITLLPVIGIVQVGDQAAADRYTYLPLIGPVACAAAGLAWVVRKGAGDIRAQALLRSAAIIVSVAACITLAALTGRQIDYWRDSVSLWSRAAGEFPSGSPVVYAGLGYALIDQGRHEEALNACSKAAGLSPGYARALDCVGEANYAMERFKEAIHAYDAVLLIDPRDLQARMNRGLSYMGLGDLASAEKDLLGVLGLDPSFALGHYNMACLRARQGDSEEACRWLRSAFENGFSDRDRARDDPDLSLISGEECFRLLVGAASGVR